MKKSLLSLAVFAGLSFALAAPASAGSSWWDWWKKKDRDYDKCKWIKCDKPDPGPAVPEPSSALIFGAGLLVASQVARKRRR